MSSHWVRVAYSMGLKVMWFEGMEGRLGREYIGAEGVHSMADP